MKQLIVVQFFVAVVLGYSIPCNRQRGVEVIYQGEACDCGSNLGFLVDRPKEQAPSVNYDFGYEIDVPEQQPCEKKYLFDFGVQKPIERVDPLLGSYGFSVVVPPVPQEEPKYIFDYQVQQPIASVQNDPIVGLYSNVDRVLLNRQDCAQPASECHCQKYKPSIDVMRSCPVHGRKPCECSRILEVPVRIRTKRELSIEDYALSSDGYGENQFYDRNAPKEVFNANAEPLTTIDETTKRPMLFPFKKFHQFKKPLKRQHDDSMPAVTNKRKSLKMVQPTVSGRMETNGRKINSRVRSALMKEKWAQKMARQNAIIKERQEQRKKRETENSINSVESSKGLERSRKHCPVCGTEYPCSVSGGGIAPDVINVGQLSPPSYVEYVQNSQKPVPYSPYYSPAAEPTEEQPLPPYRYVYDRLGHRYLERNGKLRLLQPDEASYDSDQLGSRQPEQYYHILENILDHNKPIIHASNIEGGHLIENPIKTTADTFAFLHEMGTHGRDANSAPPAKRSFEITPLLKDKHDGSVLLKVSPRKQQEPLNAIDSKETPQFKTYTGHSSIQDFRNSLAADDGGSSSSVEKSYQFVSLNGDKPTPLDETDEDFDVLRYIYETQTKRKHQQEKAKKYYKPSKNNGLAEFNKSAATLSDFLTNLQTKDKSKEISLNTNLA